MNDFKLPWDKAPEWAQWAAMDKNGTWLWYGKCPKRDEGGFYAGGNCTRFEHGVYPGDWKDSLQQCPKPEEQYIEYTVRIPWSDVHEELNHVAVNPSGTAIAFDEDPQKSHLALGGWVSGKSDKAQYLYPVSNWQELKFQRPKPTPENMTREQLIAEVKKLRGDE